MCSRSGPGLLGRPGDKADFWLPGFFGFFGSGFELPPLGLGAAGAGPRGVCGEVLGEWHGDGAPKVVVPDTEYGTSSRELEGVDSVVAAKLANVEVEEGAQADLAAQARDQPAHSCCTPHVIDTVDRRRLQSEQVIRRAAVAVEQELATARELCTLEALFTGTNGTGKNSRAAPCEGGREGSFPRRAAARIATSTITTQPPAAGELFGEVVQASARLEVPRLAQGA